MVCVSLDGIGEEINLKGDIGQLAVDEGEPKHSLQDEDLDDLLCLHVHLVHLQKP